MAQICSSECSDSIEGTMSISGRCLATGVPAPVVGRPAGPLRGVVRLQDRNIAAQQCRAQLKPNTCRLAASKSVIRRRIDRLQSVRVTASSAAISQSSEAPSEPPFITQPLPLGAVAMLGLGASMLTKILTFPAAFSAFASEIP